MKITAYDYYVSLQKYSKFLIEDKIYTYFDTMCLKDLAEQYCNKYFMDEFFDKDSNFIEKKYLNEYEIALFGYHPSFIEMKDGSKYFKGYKLTSKGYKLIS